MPREGPHIERLRLRVPAPDRDAAQRIGRDVARRLAEELPSTSGQLGALRVRVPATGNDPAAAAATAAAQAIRRAVGP